MRALRGSTRVRILGWVLIPVLLVLVISWVAAWTLLLQRVDDRVDTELRGEVSELRLLAEEGVDQRTGQPFTDVRSLLEQHIQRSIPDPNETMFVMVDGEVETRSSDDPPVRLDLEPALLDQVRDVQDVTLGDLETSAGDVRWVAVPADAGGQRGVFVVGIFSDLEGADVAQVMGRFAAISIGAFALAALLGWFVAGRLLAPLRDMRRTAQEISETDLSGRIPVDDAAGDDIADLARTFNDMLDRLGEAFAAQRAFIDDAGHELRTPLTIVQGHLELLEDDPEQRAATVALVLDELARMNRIVHDLQTLTKASQPGFVQPGVRRPRRPARRVARQGQRPGGPPLGTDGRRERDGHDRPAAHHPGDAAIGRQRSSAHALGRRHPHRRTPGGPGRGVRRRRQRPGNSA